MARWASPLAPGLVGIGVFFAGLVLLLSGATPAVHGRLRWLDERLPLAVLELSHLAGAVVGAQLLLLSRGLQRRLRHAWTLGVWLLGAGAAFSLLKGLDWEEALLVCAVLAALLPSRREFYREASLLQEPFEAGWVAAVAIAMLSALGLGLFAYKHVDYSHDLWLQFELAGDASRFLRASAASLGVGAFFAVAHYARPRRVEPAAPMASDLLRARAIVQQAPETYGYLALLGDKSLLFDEAGTAFLMYAREAGSFVAMGDPVGPDPARRDLAWRFRELADRHAAHTVFYEASEAALPVYLDMGLSLQKLGEEALVPLAGFSLEGGEKKGLRSACHRLEREGIRLEIVGADGVPPLMSELRAISDAWLAQKSTREKGFSMGFFDERYLSQLPVALLRRGNAILAFANLWQSGGKKELSVDLMRFRPEAPGGAMDYLFARLMSWGREQGWQSFNLGMAPFSGFEQRPLSPVWNRVATLLFEHGERFYNFQGLRAYKEKFHPIWRPRYLAAPRGFALPFVLANVAALVSRGLKGVVSR